MTLTIAIESPEKAVALLGASDRHLRMLRDAFGIQLSMRNEQLRLSGDRDEVARAAAAIEQMQRHLRRREWISAEEVGKLIDHVQKSAPGEHDAEADGVIEVFSHSHRVKAKTAGQERYIQAMMENDLTFCIGPAGTGKTYLAVAAAASLLKHGQVKRIVLARPAVEAGERLGFLPGDLAAKVNPYLRPLFDALHDMIDFEQVKRFMVADVIEVIPLAFMRGRTLNQSVVILDEAQNTTESQMLMFLTRLGHDSKMIVTGDVSQVDLPADTPSGLADAMQRLKGIKGIGRVELGRGDIVRHRLVQNIVDAYERS